MARKKKKWLSYGANVPVRKDVCTFCSGTIDDYSRTVDHLIPESRGGIRSNSNKVYCCKSCNILKDDMTPEEFELYLSRMVRMLQAEHQKTVGRLKKIRINVHKIIKSKTPPKKYQGNGSP